MTNGFIKLMRTDVALELCKTPNALALLTIAALRAKWTKGYNKHGLRPGEALLGDYKSYGMTRAQYRWALKVLTTQQPSHNQIATITTTSKGTILKLLDVSVYDINLEANNQHNNQPTTNQQPLTNKERKKENNSCSGTSTEKLKTIKFTEHSAKPKLFPISGKNCSKAGCGMPAIYKNTSGAYDSFACADHMPEKVRDAYVAG